MKNSDYSAHFMPVVSFDYRDNRNIIIDYFCIVQDSKEPIAPHTLQTSGRFS